MKKKPLKHEGRKIHFPPSICKIMKLSAFLFFLSVLQVWAAESYSQKARLTLHMQNVTINSVLNSIENQSEFFFLYSPKIVDVNSKVSITCDKGKIERVLNQLFAGTDVRYVIKDRRIVLTTAEQIKPFTETKQAQQQITVTGIVTDEDGNPLPGTNIIIKGTTQGTITDANGKYTLSVDPNATLVFSFVGYKSQEIPVAGKGVINVTLNAEAMRLEEVVAVGYGVQEKKTLVGAVSQADGESILRTGGATTLGESLSGLMPGILVIQGGFQPGGENTTITIRGKSSWNGNDPLFLIDGIERDFNYIDQNEIESISVLKDASATAVFGVRGANGVILVTTKRGTEGKAKIRASAKMGIKQMIADYEYIPHATSMELYNEALANDGSYDLMFSEQYIDNWRNNVDPYFYPEIRWDKELLKPYGISQAYNINVSGGNKFMKYFTSAGYTYEGDMFKSEKQKGYDPRFKYEKFNFRSNFDFDITESTKLSVGLSAIISNQNQPGSLPLGGGYGMQQFFRNLYATPNYLYPLYWEDGTFGNIVAGGTEINNLLLQLNYSGQNIKTGSSIFSDFILNQKMDFITKGLSAKARVSYDNRLSGSKSLNYTPVSYYYESRENYENGVFSRLPNQDYAETPITGGSGSVSSNVRNFYSEASVNYDRKFGGHHVTAMGLILWRQVNNNTAFKARQHSYVGRITYNWSTKYMAEFNGAYNGSEKFAPGYRLGFFPSGAIGWIASEEPFIKNNLEFVDKLKFRYSLGQSGSDAGVTRFAYRTTYNSYNISGWRYGVHLGDPMYTISDPFIAEGTPANPYMTWEVATKQNLGIELDLFKHLFITADFYNEKRKGIFTEQIIPCYVGIRGSVKGNIGKTKTKGTELSVTYRGKIGSDFNYSINGNIAYVDSRVIVRSDPENMPDYQKAAGKPIGYRNIYLANGFYNSWNDVYNSSQYLPAAKQITPGDLMYVDYNADGVVDKNDMVVSEHQNFPDVSFGIKLDIGYKGLRLTTLLSGVDGVYSDIGNVMLWSFRAGAVVAQPPALNRWTPQTAETATHPALHINNYQNETSSSFSFTDASYWRVKNVELSYLFNKAITTKLKMSSLQVYLNARNLFTITNFDKRVDPEQTTGTTATGEAASAGAYPALRNFGFGFRVSF